MKTYYSIFFILISSIVYTQNETAISTDYMVGNWKESQSNFIDGKKVTSFVRSNYKENANMFRFSRNFLVTYIPYKKPSKSLKPLGWCGSEVKSSESPFYYSYEPEKNQLIHSNGIISIIYQIQLLDKNTFILYAVSNE